MVLVSVPANVSVEILKKTDSSPDRIKNVGGVTLPLRGFLCMLNQDEN
jgi:hypothetical protein